MNNYYRSVGSEIMTDFESYYRSIAESLPNEAKIVECGISDGRSVILMASLMKNLGKSCEIWAVDNFDYGHENQRNDVYRNIIRSGEDTINIFEMTSLDASCRFEDGYLNFVYIDSSHLYEQTKAEIRLWIRKVKQGGVLAGHDFNFPTTENPEPMNGVIKAVNEVVPKEFLTLHNTTYFHGVWEIKKVENLIIL